MTGTAAHPTAALPAATDPRPLLLHVGCGRAPLPPNLARQGFRELRVDIDPAVQPDLVGSITDLSAVPAGGADAVFSSHNLEHVAAHEVPLALAEFLRVLRPGGVAWILVPDVQALAAVLARGELDTELYASSAGPISATDILWGHGAALAQGRHHMAHRTGFSAATLERALQRAGFAPVQVQRHPAAYELFATAHRPMPTTATTAPAAPAAPATPAAAAARAAGGVGAAPVAAAAPAAQAVFDRGRAAHNAGRFAEAEQHYAQAIARDPRLWPAWLERGVVRYALGRLEEAVADLAEAVRLEPRFARAQAALGSFLGMAGRPQQALPHLERAAELEPGTAEHHYNLGKALQEQGLVTRSEAAYRQALRLDPAHGLAHMNLGKLLVEQGRLADGLPLYRRGLEHLDDPGLHCNLPMLLNFAHTADDDEVFAAHRAYDERFLRPLDPLRGASLERSDPLRGVSLPCSDPLHPNTPDPARRLRLGYVSRDLRRHSVRYFLLPLLRHHDKAAVEVTCYFDAEHADDATALFREQADRWRHSFGMSDEALAAQVRADGIDVLVDLGGHTDRNRLRLFARRPAPVQVSWLGYPATTGSLSIGWRLTDRHLDPEPPAAAVASSEQPLRLAHGHFCYEPLPDSPPVGPPAFEREGAVTFGSLNQGAKLNEALFAAWARILAAVPGSRLWLQHSALHEPAAREWTVRQLQRLGVDPSRVVCHAYGRAPEYLRSYHRIDIALDSFPYNGGTTTCEALWMGVPVVSRRGGRHVARLGASILHAVGLPELVADDEDGYVARAVALAQDRPRLAALRAGMRARMQASPLMDHAGFARAVEAALRHAWVRWCAPDGADRTG
jgi:predicted O-linked N-acetylglucosamine transferase (SPINDLY family)